MLNKNDIEIVGNTIYDLQCDFADNLSFEQKYDWPWLIDSISNIRRTLDVYVDCDTFSYKMRME